MQLLGALAMFASLMGPQGSSDRAIVVGIPSYPAKLHAPPIPGCQVDAKEFAAQIAALGFKPKLLIKAEETTHDQIVQILKAEQDRPNAKGRFVFYFAGHGRDGHPGLLPSDALPGPGNDISPEELRDLIKAVPAASRTVILDACYSGAVVIKGDDSSKDYQIRSYRSQRAKEIPGLIKEASEWPASTDQGICYYTATNGNQPAVELKIGQEFHGVFTHSLIESLKAPTVKDEAWGTLDSSVQGRMTTLLKDTSVFMNPVLSDQFRDKPVFGSNADAPKVIPPPQSVLNLFDLNATEAKQLSLSVNPSQPFYHPGTVFKFEAACGQEEGWLVLVDRCEGKYQILFPRRAGKADIIAWTESARVKPGSIPLPVFFTLEPGTQLVKGFWFNTEVAARSFLGNLSLIDLDGKGFSYDPSVMSKELGFGDSGKTSKVVTAVVQLQVTNLLEGDGGGVADLYGLFKAVHADLELQNVLLSNSPTDAVTRFAPYLQDNGRNADARAGGLLLAILNLAIRQISTSATPMITGNGFSEQYLNAHPLPKEMRPTEGTHGAAYYTDLNVKILRAWFPKEMGTGPAEPKGSGHEPH